jgi:hypothetical protein
MSLRSTLTPVAGQTAASDLDLANRRGQKAAQTHNKVNLAYLNQSMKELENISSALQKHKAASAKLNCKVVNAT